MAFENLSGKLQDVFNKLRGKGKLTEKDVKSALREVKLALLEADVNFKIVKDFISAVTERAIGGDVLDGLNPAQQVIKIVNDELVSLMGSTQSMLTFSSSSPTVYMMVGLQGAGKTTTAGKLAGRLRKQGKHPLLAACDVYRPAAIKQLQVVGKTYNIPVFEQGQTNPVDIAKQAVKYASGNGNDVVIIDTAGRLHINEELMDELANIKAEVKPQEILLVIDAMTGQDAVNVAESFNEKLGLDGIIITKLDGDTRGGAALSVRAVTGKPIKYVGMGEKLEDLEPFYPDRMASRILGMGDVLMKDIIKMLPGAGKLNLDELNIEDNATAKVEAIIQSMTVEERRNPDILNGSRKKRIAKGSGRSIQEVNQLLKQFNDMKRMMKSLTDMTKGRKNRMKFPFFPG